MTSGNALKVMNNDTVLEGASTGETAGQKMYLAAGGGLTSTRPTATGTFIVIAGYWKNATDFYCDIRVIKRNK